MKKVLILVLLALMAVPTMAFAESTTSASKQIALASSDFNGDKKNDTLYLELFSGKISGMVFTGKANLILTSGTGKILGRANLNYARNEKDVTIDLVRDAKAVINDFNKDGKKDFAWGSQSGKDYVTTMFTVDKDGRISQIKFRDDTVKNKPTYDGWKMTLKNSERPTYRKSSKFDLEIVNAGKTVSFSLKDGAWALVSK